MVPARSGGPPQRDGLTAGGENVARSPTIFYSTTPSQEMNQNSVYVDLLGCQVYLHRGAKYTTRIIEAGQGPALIMMHGGGGPADAYSRNFARLARKFRVMAVDFIWHGLSSKPEFRSGNWLKQFIEQ